MTHIISGSVIDTDHPLRVDQVDRVDDVPATHGNVTVVGITKG